MSEWKTVSLQEVVRPDREITYGIVQPGPDVRPDGVPLIRGMDYSGGSIALDELYHVKPEIDAPYTRSKVKGGDVLLSIVGNVGLIAMVPDALDGANITQTTARISVDQSRFDHHFIYQAVKSEEFQLGVRKYVKGSAQPGLNLSDVRRLKLLAPKATTTQRTIARILGTVDGLIERTEALVAKQQQIKQGLLHDLFTRGVDAQGALRPPHSEAPELYHETALGWLPKGWRVEKLGNVASVRGRVGWKGYTVHDLRDSGPLVLGAAQISKDNRLKLDEPVFLSLEKYMESPEIKVEEGDLLVVQRGSIGKVVMVDEPIGPATINPSMILLKVGGANATYLYHWLCTPALQDQIINATSSTGVPMISQAQTGAFTVPLPDPKEQDAIAARMSAMMDRIRLEEKELSKFKLLKSGLMQDLLTGRVSVEQLAAVAPTRLHG